jgi:uncharacterized protein
MDLQFEWDEAMTVFADPNALTRYDRQHSIEEDRFIDIGRSTSGQILVVIHTDREKRIRIISSRKATTSERKQYEQQ